MGRILTNYPPKMPLTAEQKRKKESERLLKAATKFMWWYKIKSFFKL